MGRLTEWTVVNIKNKSHAVTAEVVVPVAGARDVTFAQGDRDPQQVPLAQVRDQRPSRPQREVDRQHDGQGPQPETSLPIGCIELHHAEYSI